MTSAAAGLAAAIRVYPDAHHGFDRLARQRYVAERDNQRAPSGRGATTGGDRVAWAAARAEVARFFAERLKSGR